AVKENGWVYRLPTAAEWEYACRGGPQAKKEDCGFHFYLDRPANTLVPVMANFNNALKRPCKVGSYLPNPLGLFDMHGNVAEWCEDTVVDDKGVALRAHRVGGWDQPSRACQAGQGGAAAPLYRAFDLGLRLARVRAGESRER